MFDYNSDILFKNNFLVLYFWIRKMRKRQVLLFCLIEEYLKNGQPIGSQTLKVSNNIKMSPATIRNHFKRMMDEGLLSQTHISSGRTPTHLAFKNYWRERLNLDQEYSFSSFSDLEKRSDEIGCFVGVYYPSILRLLQLEVIAQAWLVLNFGEGREVVLRYSEKLKRFLDDLVGMELEDIQSFCLQVRAMEVFYALNVFTSKHYRFFGARHIVSFMQNRKGEKLFFDLCDGEIFRRLSNGIYFDEVFPKNYLALIFDAKVEDKYARVLYCGGLDRNYLIS